MMKINPNDLLIHSGIESFRRGALENQIDQLLAENADLKAQIAAAKAPAATTSAPEPAATTST